MCVCVRKCALAFVSTGGWAQVGIPERLNVGNAA